MVQLAVPSLVLNCQIGYLFAETGDSSFLSINSVKNCMALLCEYSSFVTGKNFTLAFFVSICYEIRQLIASLFLPIIAVPMLKFVHFSKANVVLLVLLRNCEKRSFVSLRAVERGAIFFFHISHRYFW